MIRKPYLKALFFALFLFGIKAFAQTNEAGIKKAISNLFDGMKKGDTSMIRSAFSPSAVMQTIVKNKDGKVQVRNESVDAFIVSIGQPHSEAYDERLSYDIIKTDADLAIGGGRGDHLPIAGRRHPAKDIHVAVVREWTSVDLGGVTDLRGLAEAAAYVANTS